MKKSSLLVLVAFLCSCAMPVTTVRTKDDRPTLAINGAPEEAILYIDGISMGKAKRYTDQPGNYDPPPTVLIVEPGTHRVKVVAPTGILYDNDVFVESELKTITVR